MSGWRRCNLRTTLPFSAHRSKHEKVASLWGEAAARRHNQPIYAWLDSPLLLQLYFQPLTKSEGGTWLACQVKRLNIPKNGRWLGVGCDAGGIELFAAEHGLCAYIEGVDMRLRLSKSPAPLLLRVVSRIRTFAWPTWSTAGCQKTGMTLSSAR